MCLIFSQSSKIRFFVDLHFHSSHFLELNASVGHRGKRSSGVVVVVLLQKSARHDRLFFGAFEKQKALFNLSDRPLYDGLLTLSARAQVAHVHVALEAAVPGGQILFPAKVAGESAGLSAGPDLHRMAVATIDHGANRANCVLTNDTIAPIPVLRGFGGGSRPRRRTRDM